MGLEEKISKERERIKSKLIGNHDSFEMNKDIYLTTVNAFFNSNDNILKKSSNNYSLILKVETQYYKDLTGEDYDPVYVDKKVYKNI